MSARPKSGVSRGGAGVAAMSAPVSWATMPPAPVFGRPGRKPPLPVEGGVGAIAVGIIVAVAVGDGRGVIVGGTAVGGTAVGATAVGDGDGDGLGLALGDGEGDGLALGDGDALGDGLGLALGAADGEALGDGEGEALGDGLGAAPVSAKVVPASTVGVLALVSTSAM